jgi:hypothetical protein
VVEVSELVSGYSKSLISLIKEIVLSHLDPEEQERVKNYQNPNHSLIFAKLNYLAVIIGKKY